MARARRVEVELGDGGADDEGLDDGGLDDEGLDDAPDDDALPRASRRRWWWLAVPVVAVVALVVGQVLTDARERGGSADLAGQPGVVERLDGPFAPAWQVDPATRLEGAARAGDVIVASRVTDDLAVALEGVDVATGAGLWSHEVVAARPDLGDDAFADPVACVTVASDERLVACLVPDSAFAAVDGAPVTVPATSTRLLVVEATTGEVRDDREAPTWARWMTPAGDDVLLTGSRDGTLLLEAQDPRDGTTRWRTTHESTDGLPPVVVPVATLLDEATIAVDTGTEVVFVSAADGSDLFWLLHDPDAGGGQRLTARTTMSTALGAALVSLVDGGTQVVSADLDLAVKGDLPQVLVDDGSVPGLVLTRTPHLTAWDAGDGAQRWRTQVVDAQDVTVLDGRVHVGTSTDLVTLDGATGEELWRFDRPSASGGPVTDGRYLFTTARQGDRHTSPYDLVALHPADGSEAWRAPLPDRSWPQSVAGLLVAVSYGADASEEVLQVLREAG